MKRTGIFMAALAFASMCFALPSPAQNQKKDAQAVTPAAPAPTPGKRPPQAKTQPEYDAYNAAASNTVPGALEKTADDFAQKYPDSELRILLYKQAMRSYQGVNNAEKTIDMGRKILALDGDDPEALIDVAQILAERTRDTDLDKDQRYDEAVKLTEKALQTVDTDLAVAPGTPQDKIDLFKSFLRSTAYGVLGTIYFNKGLSKDTKEDYVKAEDNLRKSIDALPSQPDPVSVLRLSIALDKQGRYTDALAEANKAVQLTKEGTPVGDPARKEQDRLQKLTANSIK
jgi:tetratricopeptide (TPR) repeat protein